MSRKAKKNKGGNENKGADNNENYSQMRTIIIRKCKWE